MILGVDPGTTHSALVWWQPLGSHLERSLYATNAEVLGYLQAVTSLYKDDDVVLEMIASYGMPVGREVFETAVWIGRFQQVAIDSGAATHFVYRRDVKLHLCGSPRAKDGNIRQALIDKLGPPGTKKKPGATYGISGDLWAALAVAVTFAETRQGGVGP